MNNYLVSIGIALFTWWSTTALVLFLNHLPKSTYRWSILFSTPLMVGAFFGLQAVVGDSTVNSAVLAFAFALTVWAWLEMTYFMGWLSGPSKEPCPPYATGTNRFLYGLATSLYHELAVIGAGLVIIVMSWQQPNQIGMLTFLVLWIMRWSAKMNLFLGVPNVNHEWFPPHLAYLSTYIRRQPVGPLFLVSIILTTIFLVQLCFLAGSAATDFHQIGFTLVASLLGLALLEHVFMAIPMQDSALWDWAKRLAQRQT